MANETTDESCSGSSCCVFPVILSFTVGAILRQAFRWFRTHCVTGIPPYTLCVIAIGVGFALATTKEDWEIFKLYSRCLEVKGHTILHVTLPLLVFQPTFTTEIQVFKKSLNQVLLLAVTGYAIMVVMTGVVIHYLFFASWGFYAPIVLGLAVCATDPQAVDEAVKVSGVSTHLAALLQGESMIGGAVGMICYRFFILLLKIETAKEDNGGTSTVATAPEAMIIAVESMFAPVFGILSAVLTVIWLSRIFNDATLEITIVLSVVHLSYYISELLRMPGVLTVMSFGFYLSSCRSSISHTVEATMKKLVRVLTDISNSVVFFYAGVFLVRDGLEDIAENLPRDVLIWIVINVLRILMVFFISPVLQRLGLGMSWEHTLTVWIAALSGSFNIIMAMMASQDLTSVIGKESGQTFFQTAMVLLILKQFLNTTTTRLLLRTIGLRSIAKSHQTSLANAMRWLKLNRAQTINALKSDRFMADAGFDIVEADTQIDDMFQHFAQKRLSVSTILKKIRINKRHSRVSPSNASSDEEADEDRETKGEAILMVIKTQKKSYWRHFDRGLMSKEALHQLIDWADTAADHTKKYLDVREVKKASEVRPLLKSLKRQVRVKLRQLQKQSQQSHGWHYWQQQVLPKAMGYGFHLIDTLLIIVAIAMEFFKDCEDGYCREIRVGLVTWNAMVLGVYGMIALGELLVMRLKFFKIVWHDITLLIVLTGLVDMVVMILDDSRNETAYSSSIGHTYVRICFILSRSVRLLGMVEIVPGILKRLLTMLEKRISCQLGVGFDICCAYVTGQVEVVRQLDSIVHDEALLADLKRDCTRSKLDIIRTLGVLALENPTIALSVKTRHAIRIVLNAQHDTVKQLKEEGALQETDAALLCKDLEERMKKLLNSPPLVEDDSEDNMIKNVGWVQGDEQLYQYIKDNVEIWTFKPNAVITEQDQNDSNIYIIRTGVARLERRMSEAYNVSIVDYITTGNVLGELNFLTKSLRDKTVRCETPVTVLVLKEQIMEMALERHWNKNLPPLLYRMWLSIAKRVAIKVFLNSPDYQAISSERLRMMMYNAYLRDCREGKIISLHSDPTDQVILIHGNARDAFTRQPFEGPCVIPKTCFQLELQPEEGLYTLLMVIPEEPDDFRQCIIQPTRCGHNIDASVLAFTSSAEALIMADLIRAQIRTDEDVGNKPFRAHRQSADPTDVTLSGSSEFSQTLMQSVSTMCTLRMDDDVVVQPSRKQRAAAAAAEVAANRLQPETKPESHVPSGSWVMSDVWEDVPKEMLPPDTDTISGDSETTLSTTQ